jgi:hypothetical protein
MQTEIEKAIEKINTKISEVEAEKITVLSHISGLNTALPNDTYYDLIECNRSYFYAKINKLRDSIKLLESFI